MENEPNEEGIIITVTFKAEASFTHTIQLSKEEYELFKDVKSTVLGEVFHRRLLSELGQSPEFDYIEHDSDIEEIEFDEDSIGQRKYLFDAKR